MGNDVDDAMALAIIHALENRGECRLLGVTLTKDNVYAIRFVDLLNTFYGRGDIPIGVVDGGVLPGDGKYLKHVATAADDDQLLYPHDVQDRNAAPDSVKLLRQILAAQPDASVVIAQVGFSTNLARLLDSPADDISPLDGKSLVKKKVRLLSAMAGAFTKQLLAKGRKEFNVVRDIPAAQRVFGSWPTPVVISGWEIGAAIKHPGVSMREDYRFGKHHPLVDAYHHYRGLENDQPTYDLTSVLYAVRPKRGYFDLSPPGRMVVDDEGITRFRQEEGGSHRYLTVNDEQIARVREAQVMLCSQPPTED
jgi:inosine-uridine nucleoside N-ribohydrolase